MRAEIEFSLIGSLSNPIDTLLTEFEEKQRASVRLHFTDWRNGWQEVVGYSLHGNEPHISHIGMTWVSSLMRMNALRPFQSKEINALGGANAFLEPCWQSLTDADGTAWGLPWTSYTFLIAYRRDLLEKAGVDETHAFSSAQALENTLIALKDSGVAVPWAIPTCQAHTDTLHFVASWLWGAGGKIASEDGKAPLFADSLALAGMKSFYALYRYMVPDATSKTADELRSLFWNGQAAVTICGVDEPYIRQTTPEGPPEIFDRIGFAPVPGVPWVGGDGLVIWRSAQISPTIEQASVALASYLVSPQAQRTYCQMIQNHHKPTRMDVLPDLPQQGSNLTNAVKQALTTGRSYRPIPLWGRIESQLSSALNTVWEDIFAGKDPEDALHSALDPLSRRLKITLTG
ncbi:MAG: extracellular solute-binding protein [Anaerolineales bacterium]|nr:extracellular solute-binding protein [Anaerolineales bacterium]